MPLRDINHTRGGSTRCMLGPLEIFIRHKHIVSLHSMWRPDAFFLTGHRLGLHALLSSDPRERFYDESLFGMIHYP